jgi:hypothetical protein
MITTSLESASLSVGNVTGEGTLLFRRQMTNMGTMTGEGGGNGVSDVLSLFSFGSAGAPPVGFLAMFQSDTETGISPPPGNFPSGVTNLLENGNLQLLTPGDFTVTLPGAGLVPLGGKCPIRCGRGTGSSGRRWPSRPDLGEWWPSRLVATAEEDRLNFRRNAHTSFAAASDSELSRFMSTHP